MSEEFPLHLRILNLVHAFSDKGRKDEARQLALEVEALQKQLTAAQLRINELEELVRRGTTMVNTANEAMKYELHQYWSPNRSIHIGNLEKALTAAEELAKSMSKLHDDECKENQELKDSLAASEAARKELEQKWFKQGKTINELMISSADAQWRERACRIEAEGYHQDYLKCNTWCCNNGFSESTDNAVDIVLRRLTELEQALTGEKQEHKRLFITTKETIDNLELRIKELEEDLALKQRIIERITSRFSELEQDRKRVMKAIGLMLTFNGGPTEGTDGEELALVRIVDFKALELIYKAAMQAEAKGEK